MESLLPLKPSYSLDRRKDREHPGPAGQPCSTILLQSGVTQAFILRKGFEGNFLECLKAGRGKAVDLEVGEGDRQVGRVGCRSVDGGDDYSLILSAGVIRPEGLPMEFGGDSRRVREIE